MEAEKKRDGNNIKSQSVSTDQNNKTNSENKELKENVTFWYLNNCLSKSGIWDTKYEIWCLGKVTSYDMNEYDKSANDQSLNLHNL